MEIVVNEEIEKPYRRLLIFDFLRTNKRVMRRFCVIFSPINDERETILRFTDGEKKTNYSTVPLSYDKKTDKLPTVSGLL